MSSESISLPDYAPYVVSDSDICVEDVWSRVNEAVYYGHCLEESAVKADRLSEYDRLLAKLNELGIVTVPFCDIDPTKPPSKDHVTCLLRHDLDIDVVSALRMSELEKRHGARSTYFVLHTSPYYGEFRQKSFHRYSCMRHIYRQMQDLDQEIAFHTDGLHVYQDYKTDGGASIEQEIAWLREAGLEISGTAAHNSWSVYGAENFAIFKGRSLRAKGQGEQCPTAIEHEGKVAPLQVLDEAELGLTYEANDIFWQNEAPVRYAALRGADSWRWADDNSRCKSEPLGVPADFISTDQMLSNLEHIKKGEWLVLAIHPVYYGFRHAKYAEPSQGGIEI